MSNDHQSFGAVERRSQTLPQCRRIERAEALVQDYKLCVLQQCARHKHPAAFAVRELPSGFTNHLLQAGWHSVKQSAQTELATERLGCGQVFFARRPSSSHQQIESEGPGEDVVFMKLRG